MGNFPQVINILVLLGKFFFRVRWQNFVGYLAFFLVLNSLLILELLVQLYFVFISLTFLILIRGHFLYFQTE